MPLLALLAICLSGRGAEAKYGGGSDTMASAETSTYMFLSDESAVVQTGGIAGVHKTYSIEGQFRLIIDFDTVMASFDQVNANLVDESPFLPTQSLGELFNMAELIGTVVGDMAIEFEGKTTDGTNSDILLRLTFRDDSVHLTGRTVPPPNSADFFIYELDAVARKKYSGGTGEPNDPCQIATTSGLMLLGESPDDYDKHFILTADIDLDSDLPGRKVFDKAVIAADTDQTKDWFQGTPFTGVFDGKGHTISHLTITGGGYLGLFGQLGPGAKISNLGLEAVDVNGADRYVGGLVGRIGSWESRGGVLTNCYSTGTVTGVEVVGGLVGDNFGSITTSYSTCTVRGEWCVGGLMGGNGVVDYPMGGVLTNCYSAGMVDGEEFVGGLVGYNNGSITTCYSTGMVIGNENVGGLIGRNYGSIATSFWDVETSGLTTSAGGMGRTTAEMMAPEMLGLNGLANNPNWILDAYRDYPHLAWEGTVGDMIPWPVIHWLDGNGTVESPYQIATVDQLSRLSRTGVLTDRHFILVSDLDLSGLSWSKAVIPYFSGCFDGNGFVLHHLHIQGINDLGLIGHLGRGAIITNLGLKDASIEGTDKVGSLVGRNNGSISNCYSTGEVNGDADVGGLVGSNGLLFSDCGLVTRCYSTSAVSGKLYVGGLVGFNFGNVSRCYSTGTVSGVYFAGGLVGGRSEIATDCFWDIETSGVTISNGGTGKTTAQMQTAGTFLDASWDFVDETTNGTEDIWWILKGQDYPRLWWELLVFSPDPHNGAVEVIQPLILRWVAGVSAMHHDIYFGEDEEAVANATTLSLGIYRGQRPAEITTYDPGPLEWDKTYYWRIDEINEADPNSLWKGDVWSFTTADFILIDDFEDYNDYPPDEIFSTWIDGYNVPENGAIVCYCDMACWWCSRCNPKPVHGGAQSMDIRYDNSGPAYYSEATKTLVYPRDWTEEGVGVLSLWLYGDPNNDAERMYVALNGNAVVYHDNPDAALIDTWTEWKIDLQEFAAKGVNLANVNTISIGFGDKNNIKAGGSGLVFFDDIRLYRPAPSEPEPAPAPMTSGGFSKARTIPDCGGS